MKRLLHECFSEQARRTPDAIAVRHGSQTITWGELEARASRIAGSLVARGIGSRSVVGLHMERSIDQVSAQLGILKSGAAVLPLPPAYPQARQARILDFAAPSLVIDAEGSRLGHRSGPAVLTVESLLSDPREVTGSADPTNLDEETIAFVLSSSGSTGRPKLIARSHRSFFHRLTWTWDRHPYREGEVCCQKAHMTTTHSIYELFEPLLTGVETVIVPDPEVRELERFWEVIREAGVTRLLIVPSPLRASLAMPGFEPPPLEVVVIMGEYVSPRLAGETLRRFPESTRIYSIYGSTEASSTLVCDLRELYHDGEDLPLGTPISADTRAVVLDEGLNPVKEGGIGRLYIGGPALFSGYLGDEAATADAFIDEPGSGCRLYDTRDEVELTSGFGLRYLGRVDHTVKVRGFRVNTGEVENALRTHPQVTAAVVLPETGPGGDVLMVAFVTPGSIEPASVFETARARLPEYMVPSAVVPLDAFPMTASAKIDRVRLLEDRQLRRRAGPERSDAAEELTAGQRRVREVWARTLEHEAFGLDSSWFEVGGSSLTVFALVHRLREATGLDRAQLNEQTVYRRPTVRELSDWIENPRPVEDEGASAPPLLVPLRSGAGSGREGSTREPLFVVASAGGTLGAYARLARSLETDREILGVRDPMIWGGREGNEGFRSWAGRYLDAIRQRQPQGPYYICAYSSAGAFGFEIARRLREQGEEVALLALVEPLALDRGDARRFGYWALRATWMRPAFRELVRAAGWMRVPFVRLWERLRGQTPDNDHRFAPAEYEALSRELTSKREHLVNLSRLMELNSGLPYALDEVDVEAPDSTDWMERLRERVRSVSPEVDLDSIERIAVQYQLQVRTHHAYRLSRYDGEVLLVEPQSRYSGILAALLRPYVRRLTRRQIPLDEPSERARALTSSFGGLTAHYRCMRDDRFVAELAALLEPRLE